MRVLRAAFIMLVSSALISGCGDSATEIVGTLPVVTGITVDSMASTGDTIVVTWNRLTGSDIDGYFFWSRTGTEDPWMLVNTVADTVGVHLADRSAYYTVMAYYGNDTSHDIGLAANTMTENLSQLVAAVSSRPIGFRIDQEGDSLVSGDPSSPDFNQQFTVATSGLGSAMYVYPGTAHPDEWPGGMRTRISSHGGFVAPPPDDPTLWKDSISFGGYFFLALEDDHYCMLNGEILLPDTMILGDTLTLEGWLQPLAGVRVFN